ncbi:MAG: hypothetical protein V3V00_08395, partial [Saprospiraceae bacterium]
SSCDDGIDCTENDKYDSNCNCIGVERDDDTDGVCNALDKCHGFPDHNDEDRDGIPDGCDVQDECGSCQPNKQGKIFICKIPRENKDAMVNISGKCRDLGFLYGENGGFISSEYSCGQCKCENIGDVDTDGDGVCDRRDKCPEDAGCR